jgi:4-alpha-glucanotransferase
MCGIQTGYRDAFGQWRSAGESALLRALEALDVPLGHPAQAGDVLRGRRRKAWGRVAQPVNVLWDDQPHVIPLRLRRVVANGPYEAVVEHEDGRTTRFHGRLEQMRDMGGTSVEGESFFIRGLAIPSSLPWGYHRLQLQCAGQAFNTLLLRAPLRAASLPGEGDRPRPVLFAPLYALQSRRGWGAGDYSDLGEFADWAARQSVRMIATLPLLPTFLEQPFEPSPYSPISRLFWSEFFVDPRRAPEFEACEEARRLVGATSFQLAVDELRSARHVDYARLWSLKRPVLAALARHLRQSPARWRERMDEWSRAVPSARDYARFRAYHDARSGAPWMQWPEPARSGRIELDDCDPAAVDLYLYSQRLAHEQMRDLADDPAKAKLYLDLPLGANPDGFDLWRERRSFASGISTGAPPDPIFTGGQDWGFAPFHPEHIREDGYRYLAACLRHHFSCARVLRIDHAMCFHRLFWVPHGMGASHGVYVRYRPEEFYAVLTLESRRHEAALVGEDLGTVPGEVRDAMERHGVRRTYAMQLELRPSEENPLGRVPEGSVACVNTHDLVPFAAFWAGEDVEERRRAGLLSSQDCERERADRDRAKQCLVSYLRSSGRLGPNSAEPEAILLACLRELCQGPAALVQINLEDLWGERERQNLPGSTIEHPNWTRKLRHPLDSPVFCGETASLIRQIALLCGSEAQ